MSETGYFFNEFHNKITIEGKIEAITGIHIGASDNSFEPMTVNSIVVKDGNKNPFIPGSTIKGVMRSYLERILSIPEINKDTSKVNICTANDTCISRITKNNELKEEYNKAKKDGSESFATFLNNNTCTVCKIFGTGDNSSKVLFRDMKVVKNSFLNCEIRSGISIDRDLNITNDGALFEVEIVPSGTQFEFMMIAENLTNNQWECLKYALKALEKGDIDIGGMRSRGLGQVKLTGLDGNEASAKYVNRKNFKNYIMEPDKLKQISFSEIIIEG